MSKRRFQPGDRVRVTVHGTLYGGGEAFGSEGIVIELGPFAHSVLLDQDAHLGPDEVRFFALDDLEWLEPNDGAADAHSCANCGDDPGTCLFNGEKEGS